jgi:hypothetical protein
MVVDALNGGFQFDFLVGDFYVRPLPSFLLGSL